MTNNASRPIEIHGYAIITDDNMISGGDGIMPSFLRNAKDWEYYQAGLARADVVVFGRRSHENEPNTTGQRRIVVTRSVPGFERRSDAHWWNPESFPWAQVAYELLPDGGEVAAPGGQSVFDLFLGVGYTAFHLSHKRGYSIPGGQTVFSACADGRSAEQVLAASGLRVNEVIPLDPADRVEMNVWRRG